MSKSLTVFMPCAGLGSRLRPLTTRIPKPLIPFQGKSALKINWEKLKSLQPQKIICNSHHLPEAIKTEAQDLGIEVIHEEKLLGTGGCLTNLKSMLSQTEYFLVHNADILHNIDIKNFVLRTLQSSSLGNIAGTPHDHVNTLSVKPDGTLGGIKNYHSYTHPPKNQSLTFTGIAMYRSEFLNYCDQMPDDLVNIWLRAISQGESFRVHDCTGAAWFDFGEPQGLWDAALWVMNLTGNHSFQYKSKGKNPLVSNEPAMDLSDKPLQSTLILEKPDFSHAIPPQNSIVGKDFAWPIK